MNHVSYVFIILTILLCVGFSGCMTNNLPDTERNKFVGTWIRTVNFYGQSRNDTLTIFSDGTTTGSLSMGGNWELKDGKFVISADGIIIAYNYYFSDNDKKLTLTMIVAGGEPYVYTKQYY